MKSSATCLGLLDRIKSYLHWILYISVLHRGLRYHFTRGSATSRRSPIEWRSQDSSVNRSDCTTALARCLEGSPKGVVQSTPMRTAHIATFAKPQQVGRAGKAYPNFTKYVMTVRRPANGSVSEVSMAQPSAPVKTAISRLCVIVLLVAFHAGGPLCSRAPLSEGAHWRY
jgi:hypothetical protein